MVTALNFISNVLHVNKNGDQQETNEKRFDGQRDDVREKEITVQIDTNTYEKGTCQ
jgi:hypothetical protein